MKGSYGRYALLGALLCALLAAWLNVRFLKAQEQTVNVVMVAKELQPYTAIPADALKVTTVPKEAVPDDAVTDVSELEGHYSRALLIPGTVMRKAHLVAAGGSNLAARLAVEQAHGMRAMALQVNAATGVAGTLKEGDPVDILVAVTDEADGSESGGTFARIIAQRVPVIYVSDDEDGGTMTVVLQVAPEKAEEIAFAQANGQIWLLTSPYGTDAEPAVTTGVNPQVFFERYGIRPEEAVTASGGSETSSGQVASKAKSGNGFGGGMSGGGGN